MRKLLIIIVALLLVSCTQPTSTPTATATAIQAPIQVSPTKPPIEASATPIPTDAPVPTLTSTALPSETPTETLTPTPVVFGPDNYPADVNPLTGLRVSNPALLERRPVAAKLNVVPRSSNRPPWGLSLADIVYDYYHNDGYSRLHAIWYGQDSELIGPIRSARLLDHELIRMYKSIFTYGSADAKINRRLLNSEYSERLILEGNTTTCPPKPEIPLCRFEPGGRDLMLGSTQLLSQFITNKGVENGRQNLTGMTFALLTPEGGAAGTQAYARYSVDNYARWDYDPATGTYLRFQDKVLDRNGEEYEPLMDAVTNLQVEAENVVFIFARHEYYQDPPAEIIDILLSGIGKGYALRDGKIYEVSWRRDTVDGVLYLTLPNGAPYAFKPGNTWFQVLGENSTILQPGEGVWRFEFKMP